MAFFDPPPLPHVSFNAFIKRQALLGYIQLKIGNNCSKKKQKMLRDLLVDPLPPHVLFVDTVTNPPSPLECHVLFKWAIGPYLHCHPLQDQEVERA
jgi:hypothetical protein